MNTIELYLREPDKSEQLLHFDSDNDCEALRYWLQHNLPQYTTGTVWKFRGEKEWRTKK